MNKTRNQLIQELGFVGRRYMTKNKRKKYTGNWGDIYYYARTLSTEALEDYLGELTEEVFLDEL